MSSKLYQQRYTILFVVIMSAFTISYLVSVWIASAQTGKPVEVCNSTEVYKDGKLEFSCKIITVNGTPQVQEIDAKGTVTTRNPSTVETALWQVDQDAKTCDSRRAQANALLATPATLGTLQETQQRLQAVVTLLNVDGLCK